MKSSPRFFCEHCGAEVLRSARRCVSCGRMFSSVLCPKCGFSGAEGLFSAGCPVCGYSAPSRGAGVEPRPPSPEAAVPVGALPVWVYALTVLGLVLVVVASILLLR